MKQSEDVPIRGASAHHFSRPLHSSHVLFMCVSPCALTRLNDCGHLRAAGAGEGRAGQGRHRAGERWWLGVQPPEVLPRYSFIAEPLAESRALQPGEGRRAVQAAPGEAGLGKPPGPQSARGDR